MYLCFVGNVAVSVWLVSVWLIISCDYSDWMTAITMNADRHYELYGPYLYDYHLYYPTHQCVITDYQQFLWMFVNISVCLEIRVGMWVCTTYKAFFYLFSLLKLFLLYEFLSEFSHFSASIHLVNKSFISNVCVCVGWGCYIQENLICHGIFFRFEI